MSDPPSESFHRRCRYGVTRRRGSLKAEVRHGESVRWRIGGGEAKFWGAIQQSGI